MNDQAKPVEVHYSLLAVAAIVVIVAGMRAASVIIVPFLLSIFLAILAGPPLAWLARRGVPRGLAMVIVLVGIALIGIALVTVVAGMVNRLVIDWTTIYQPQAVELTERWNERVALRAADYPWMESLQIEDVDNPWGFWFNPERILSYFTGAMVALTGTLSNVFFILLTTIFLLAEATILPAKLRVISSDPHASMINISRIAREINHYMGLKSWTSFLTGLVVAIGLFLFDVNYALLWGILAFFLNFVPNIGSIVAAVPAILMALVQHGLGTAALVGVLYLAVNMIIGNFLEPRWMGRGLGLSTLFVFLSLVFWGWVLGPVGMVISVPLTMALKIALESHEETRWLAVIMAGADVDQQ